MMKPALRPAFHRAAPSRGHLPRRERQEPRRPLREAALVASASLQRRRERGPPCREAILPPSRARHFIGGTRSPRPPPRLVAGHVRLVTASVGHSCDSGRGRQRGRDFVCVREQELRRPRCPRRGGSSASPRGAGARRGAVRGLRLAIGLCAGSVSSRQPISAPPRRPRCPHRAGAPCRLVAAGASRGAARGLRLRSRRSASPSGRARALSRRGSRPPPRRPRCPHRAGGSPWILRHEEAALQLGSPPPCPPPNVEPRSASPAGVPVFINLRLGEKRIELWDPKKI